MYDVNLKGEEFVMDVDALLEMESGFWEAAGDGDYYRQHMAADGICLLPVGILDKSSTVASVEGAEPWDGFEITDARTVALGPDALGLYYLASGDRKSFTYRAAVATVYRRVDGSWQLTMHQQTPLPAQ